MLNLTLPNFPFVVAFAVKALGWQAESVGWMAALPHVCNCLQPLLLAGLSRYFSTFQLLALTFSLGALPWGLAALPHVCNCLQPLLLAGLSRYSSTFQLLALTFSLGALPWGLDRKSVV